MFEAFLKAFKKNKSKLIAFISIKSGLAVKLTNWMQGELMCAVVALC